LNQTSLLGKDFKRKSDLASYHKIDNSKVPLNSFSKSILHKGSKKMFPINQSTSLYFSKKNLKNNSFAYETPNQNSFNYSNDSFNFTKGQYMLLNNKKKRSNKKK
jgi:hypothetical protein